MIGVYIYIVYIKDSCLHVVLHFISSLMYIHIYMYICVLCITSVCIQYILHIYISIFTHLYTPYICTFHIWHMFSSIFFSEKKNVVASTVNFSGQKQLGFHKFLMGAFESPQMLKAVKKNVPKSQSRFSLTFCLDFFCASTNSRTKNIEMDRVLCFLILSYHAPHLFPVSLYYLGGRGKTKARLACDVISVFLAMISLDRATKIGPNMSATAPKKSGEPHTAHQNRAPQNGRNHQKTSPKAPKNRRTTHRAPKIEQKKTAHRAPKSEPKKRRTTHRAPKSSPKKRRTRASKSGPKNGAPHTKKPSPKKAHLAPKSTQKGNHAPGTKAPIFDRSSGLDPPPGPSPILIDLVARWLWSTPTSAHHAPKSIPKRQRAKIEPKKAHRAPKSAPKSAHHTPRTKIEPKNGAPHTKNDPKKGTPCTEIGPKIGAPHTAHQNRAQKRRTAHQNRAQKRRTVHRNRPQNRRTTHRAPKSSPKTAHRAPKSSPKTAHRTPKPSPKRRTSHQNPPKRASCARTKAPYSTGLGLDSPQVLSNLDRSCCPLAVIDPNISAPRTKIDP